jgi:hypothetical protein
MCFRQAGGQKNQISQLVVAVLLNLIFREVFHILLLKIVFHFLALLKLLIQFVLIFQELMSLS